MTPERFGQSPAAQAFRAGKFAQALGEIDKLLAREPQDRILLRVRGMTLYQLGRMAEAQAGFEKALQAAPNDPAVLYWYAATLHKRGDSAGALTLFERIIRLSPRSRYGKAAVKSAAAVRATAQKRAGLAQAAGKPWSLSITGGSQFDDNVSLVNTDKLQSFRLFTQIDGGYTFALQDGFSLSLDGRGYASRHLRQSADDYDVGSIGARMTVSRRTRIADKQARLYLGYGFEHIWLGRVQYSSTHRVRLGSDISLWRNGITTIGAAAAFNRYADRGAGVADLFSRDGIVYGFTLRHVQYLPGRRHFVWLSYTPELTRTRGRNFDGVTHTGTLGASFSLPHDLNLEMTATLGHTRYNHYVPQPRRLSRGQSYAAQLTKHVTKRFSLSLGYSHSFDDSNIKALETHRNVVTLSGRFAF